MEIGKTICSSCHQEFTFNPELFTFAFKTNPDGSPETFFPTECESCSEAAVKRARGEAEMALAAVAREKQWKDTTPPLFRDSDESRFSPILRKKIRSHDLTGPTGVGIVGPAGTCKTRAAYVLLRRYLDAGESIHSITGAQLAEASADQFADNSARNEFALGSHPDTKAIARRTLERCKTSDVLLLDDVEKAGAARGELTPRTQHELFAILDARTTSCRPTIWTSNASGRQLASVFCENMRDPIMRRLEEFSDIISLGGRA